MDWRADDILHTNCVTFHKVSEEFGHLSNMTGDYPLCINDRMVGSSEALYQACRFPYEPDWQREIITQASPMAAKMKAKKDGRRDKHSRSDWDRLSLDFMRWALRVKLAQHFARISGLLLRTGERAIVEHSRKDRFWGTVEVDGVLVGENTLGRMLMELRDLVHDRPREELLVVEPLLVPDFLLLGEPIRTVRGR